MGSITASKPGPRQAQTVARGHGRGVRCEIRGGCWSTPHRRRRFRQGSLVRGTASVRRQRQFGRGSWICSGVERTGAPLTARPSIRCWLGMAEGFSSAMSYQPAQQFFYRKRIHVIQQMHTAKRRSCCRRSFKDSENHPQIPPTNQNFKFIAEIRLLPSVTGGSLPPT